MGIFEASLWFPTCRQAGKAALLSEPDKKSAQKALFLSLFVPQMALFQRLNGNFPLSRSINSRQAVEFSGEMGENKYMRSKQRSGMQGEKELIKLVPCPNCGKDLMLLPSNYPLYDIQCTGCSFRAQVKTNNNKPSPVARGAGWEIMDKVLKSGFMVPPLFLNFKWREKGKQKQVIRFYPFVPKKNLRKYKLSKKAHNADFWMFNYIGLDKLPYFIVYQK